MLFVLQYARLCWMRLYIILHGIVQLNFLPLRLQRTPFSPMWSTHVPIKMFFYAAVLTHIVVAKKCHPWCALNSATWQRRCNWELCGECSECGECVCAVHRERNSMRPSPSTLFEHTHTHAHTHARTHTRKYCENCGPNDWYGCILHLVVPGAR